MDTMIHTRLYRILIIEDDKKRYIYYNAMGEEDVEATAFFEEDDRNAGELD